MVVSQNYSLGHLNTLRVDVKARFFIEVADESDVSKIVKDTRFKNFPKLILGEGSNILFTKDFDGLVIRPIFSGIKIAEEDSNNILLEIGAGENWHKLVTYAVNNNWGGIENLALIPGTVGAAPVQNIAAYGESFSDVFDSLEAIDLEDGEIKRFDAGDCQFSYRNSVFKKQLKNKYIIIWVRLRLSKNPGIETSYRQIGISHDSLRGELQKIATGPYSIKDVYNAVISIRKKKLPDYLSVPTAGSFFLNPIVSKAKYEELKKIIPELPCYPANDVYYKMIDDSSLEKADFVKIAAGRLIEKIGWLGKWIGNCGVYDKHALIIVTNGKASGKEILDFSEEIRRDFLTHYGIKLETEVNVV